MIFTSHRINTINKLKKTPKCYGIEVDLRDYKKKIILSHDPFKSGDNFVEFLKEYDHKFLVLNIKSEGIESAIIKSLKKYKIKNYFFLDCSFPAMMNLIRKGNKNVSVRVSDYEGFGTLKKIKYSAKWVWVDCFNELPLTYEIYKQLKQSGFKICLVSPELQGHSLEKIPAFKDLIQDMEIDAICTKRQDLWV